MRNLLVLVLSVLLITSCKQSREDKITRKWLAVSVESPQLNQLVAQQRQFLDTVGRSTDPAANEALYGVRNLDSFRQMLKLQMDSFNLMQEGMVRNTWLDFRNDSSVVANFGSAPDTVNWYFDKEGALILDEKKRSATGATIKMDVVQLEDTVLQLRYDENGYSSTATFRPEPK